MMIELGNSFKGQYTLVMGSGERLYLESHIVNDYFAGLKTDTEQFSCSGCGADGAVAPKGLDVPMCDTCDALYKITDMGVI